MARILSLPLATLCITAPRQCPLGVISVQLLDAAGPLLRVPCLDREGQISAKPDLAPGEKALILAANQRRVLGAHVLVQLL
ncbi:MAG: hypothetical protein VKJ44_06770 [Synechococcus sp.]|nr:hypothetical protein [Synechococcus sp.]